MLRTVVAYVVTAAAVLCTDIAAMRHLRVAADQVAMPCAMHSKSASTDNDGSDSNSLLHEAGTISIGSKVFSIADEGNTMTIGDTKFRVFS
ncbi:hypothetical protein PRNP1_014195 [Phytophthora ramorum]|uniref:uncharacterized protein n=1 Tax=Phytophthora ramorum TaxID=164328 RepID=UPI0030A50105|nr:hypothetical protein KRP23_10542 [Phytophthora ramorum]